MFKRFTERARRVVVLAQNEAVHLRHNYIGTEHLLLGLLREDEGVAARALASLNVTLEEVREQVESIVGFGEEGTGGQAPFTPRSKKVLELALREALQLGHNYIGTEHILLGLMLEHEGVAARALNNLHVDSYKVRREVVRMLGGRSRRKNLMIGEDAHDPMDERDLPDEAETGMGERGGRPVFRGRVAGIRAQLELPRPLAVTVDADYAYKVSAPTSSPYPELGDVADLLRDSVQRSDASSIEDVVTALGERLLDTFPAMLEVTVTVSGPPESPDPPAPTFSLSATFRR